MAAVKAKLRGRFARSLWTGEGAEEDTRGKAKQPHPSNRCDRTEKQNVFSKTEP